MDNRIQGKDAAGDFLIAERICQITLDRDIFPFELCKLSQQLLYGLYVPVIMQVKRVPLFSKLEGNCPSYASARTGHQRKFLHFLFRSLFHNDRKRRKPALSFLFGNNLADSKSVLGQKNICCLFQLF
ncbi:Uncharacterised protein [Mycobacteroides abscessus subsp. abscessus]|nr:Uncharacterised protein [Mycobacteroides abscessus subsp. abscessus]